MAINIKISRAVKKDLNSLYKLGQKIPELKYSKESPFCEKLELAEWINNHQDNIILTAKLGIDELVGFLIAKILSRNWCMLDNIVVDKKFRGQGIANKLLNQLYNILKKEKINYINVLVGLNYKKTREFWRVKGFKETKKFVWADKEL